MKKSFDPKEVEEIESTAYQVGKWIERHQIINMIKDKAALDMNPDLLEIVEMIRNRRDQ